MNSPRIIHLLFLLCAFVPLRDSSAQEPKRPNILFIAIDDLRPELGCYGSDIVHSPVLDQLASEGRLFNRAYCQQSICSPSRASLMTGARPDEIGVIENFAYFRELNPDIVTLPQHFIAHGYEAVHSGKIYHGNMRDDELSWSREPNWKGLKRPVLARGHVTPEHRAIVEKNQKEILAKYGKENSAGLIHGPAIEAGPVEDDAYGDGFNTSVAIQTLDELVGAEKPWFLGLGFMKPHLPFIAPKKYFDLYDPSEIELAVQRKAPEGGAAVGLHASFELRTRHGIPKEGPLGDELSRDLLHAYYACTSYVDAQIGRMLKALDEHGVRDNTIIVVWGDHGWHLGEMGIWGKATNYEIATRVPLIFWTPEMAKPGEATESIIELVDLYPTLCELAGLPLPEHLDGESLVPILDDPAAGVGNVAVSQFPSPALREWAANPLSPGMRETFFGPLIEEVEGRIIEQQGDSWDRELFENHLMGYSLRTDRYRYIEWVDYRDPDGEPLNVELFDHESDSGETRNVAGEKVEVVEELRAKLRAVRR